MMRCDPHSGDGNSTAFHPNGGGATDSGPKGVTGSPGVAPGGRAMRIKATYTYDYGTEADTAVWDILRSTMRRGVGPVARIRPPVPYFFGERS